MESALDVLSRAASMIETDEASKVSGQALVPEKMRESPAKDLPTKALRQHRIQERHEPYTNKRCAGTQTTYSTWSESKHRALSQCPKSRTSPTNTTMPLGHQQRPSVICAPTTNGTTNTRNSCSPPLPGRREITTVDMCDPAIEEHFRRSLGEKYPECLSSASQTSPRSSPSPTNCRTPSPSSKMPNVLQTASVDDHFAKSLGNKWTELQAKHKELELDILAGSVDDHFAKALGDKWLKIKAERKTPTPPQEPTPIVLS